MSNPELYQFLARYNQWMNGKVYKVCSTIPDKDRRADRGAYFKSIHGMLNHLYFGDAIWMGRLGGFDAAFAPIGQETFDDFEQLHAARRKLDQDIVDWTGGLTAQWLDAIETWTSGLDKRDRSQPRWLLASHVFNHQTHHRGQLSTLLTQMGHDIGVTDLPRMDLEQ